MVRAAVASLALLGLGACASGPDEAVTEGARAECRAQGVPEGEPMSRCVNQMEEAVRAARQNGGAPPERHPPSSTPSSRPRQ